MEARNGTSAGLMKPRHLNIQRDLFLQELQRRGYSPLTIKGYADSIAHFAEWSARTNRSAQGISEDLVKLFSRHRCRCPGSRRYRWISGNYVVRVRRFLHYLECGDIRVKESRPRASVEWKGVGQFACWLREHRGIGPVTVKHYTEQLEKLPRWFVDARRRHLTARNIRSLVLKRSPVQSGSATRCMTTAMRMYLRFLGSTNGCTPGLEGAISTIPQWRLSTLPSYLRAEQVEKVIGSADLRTLLGARDRAILLLLARLGLRAGDVLNLRLTDLDWNEGRVKVCGKGRRETWLPLPQEVGAAILSYLKRRPVVALDRVFISVRAPFRSLHQSSPADIVSRALRRAGIEDAPSAGATLLRHSAATSMLRAGASLEGVSAMLRHRSLDMTVYYAKVDVPMLRQIAQPWPEAVSC